MLDPIILKVNHVSKYYPEKHPHYLKAVDNVSLEIPRGKTFGLVGESGSGKTTLGKLLIGILQPDQGEIIYNGQSIHQLMRKDKLTFTKNMQMIFQDPYASLDPQQKIYDILAEGIRIHRIAANKAEEKTKIDDLLQMVGLASEHANRYPHEFSGGQKQRIGIARALSVEPQLLICDESVSALDVTTQSQILDLLVHLQAAHHLTLIFIAHDLAVVKQISDYVAVMYLGRVVEFAKAHDLYHNPLHPYTQALLSAVPIPDPKKARQKKLIVYKKDHASQLISLPSHSIQHLFKFHTPKFPLYQSNDLKEVAPDHFVDQP